jgi:hypothetical protein
MKVERGQAALITGGGGGIGLSCSPSYVAMLLFPWSWHASMVWFCDQYKFLLILLENGFCLLFVVNNQSLGVCIPFSPGRALAVALAKRGVQVSVLDLAPAQGEETVRAVTDEHARISYKPTTPSVIFIQCDVSKTGTHNSRRE